MARKGKSFPPLDSGDWKRIEGGKRFLNKDTGEVLSRRQYDNRRLGQSLYSHQKEIRHQKAEGTYKPRAPKNPAKAPSNPGKSLSEFAKKRGATSEAFYNGGKERPLSPVEKQTAEAHNKRVDAQRLGAIDLKEKAGVLTKSQAEAARVEYRSERYWRNEMLKMNEVLHRNAYKPGGRPLSNAERARINREYIQAHRKWDAARKKLEHFRILPPVGHDLYGGYYH